MLAEFETYLKTQANFTDDEVKQICSSAECKKLRRKEVLLREGDVCRYKIFVCKGLLRTYSTKPDGSEYIMGFAPEHRWTTDPESYHKQVPAAFTIDALEDSEVLLWNKVNFDGLYVSVPRLKEFSENIITQNLYRSQRRILSTISSSVEERYDEFVSTYPDIFARVPLHMVASYLGVSRETLSRIRHAQVKR
ncbi:Crp/Fnr family transcriptional regulator [Mucilaginibacter sp. Bleaf8]|uniref:Crp/Fnr family transcriptional regulator n=1 Tax=Mucilaginibacter sp. Bleaf8 TaxID=2834430 RepID=UPI001BCC9B37|nr:Crp/Fnr family transcriptional regulator [Mucilaginibacter sp. Bleaf8]MBS7563691.1 Crp/Fnr family transcriptional regulator [Mucilaginibacter sp. Bleaf8]